MSTVSKEFIRKNLLHIYEQNGGFLWSKRYTPSRQFSFEIDSVTYEIDIFLDAYIPRC